MKKGLIVILIFLVIISITGVGLAARPPGPPLPTQGPIGDLPAQIDQLNETENPDCELSQQIQDANDAVD